MSEYDIKEEVNKESNQEDNKSLVDWTNPPSLTDLKQDFTDALSDKETQTHKVDVWLDNLNGKGKAKVRAKKGRSQVVPKVIRKQAEWRYPALSEPFLSTRDIFNVSPITHEDVEAAEQNALVLNNQFNTKIKKVSFIDEYVRTAVNEGTVILRTGWDFEEEEVTTEKPVYELVASESPDAAAMHEDLHAQMQTSLEAYEANVPEEIRRAHELTMETGVTYIPVKTDEVEEVTETKVIKNQPTVEVCDYRNIIIDPTCKGDMDKATFVIHSFDTSKAELQRDGKYKNLDNINISANDVLSEPDHTATGSSFNFNDKPRKKIVAYEYWGFWDIHDKGTLEPIVATWVGDTLIRLEENPFPDKKLPFIVVPYLPVTKSVFGEPDGELLEDNQKIIGAVTRGMIDIMGRSANGQMGTRKDALDITNKRKFDNGDDYEFNPSVDPRQAFHMATYPEIPNSAGLMLNLQNADAESMSGVKAFSGSGGITGAALGDSVGGIKSVLDATSKREMGILRRLAEGIIQVGRKFISMNSEFLSEHEVVRISNDKFVPVRRDDLAGYFDLDLTISTAEADNEKAQELAFMLQTMSQSLPPEMTYKLIANISKLRKMPELAKEIEEYRPQPDPIAQRKAELEVALLEAQIATEQSKAMENQANAQLDVAKAGTEQIKAGNIQSDTDLKNLDFLEQESGTKQERDLQKQGAQARANMDLKLVDQALKERSQPTDNT